MNLKLFALLFFTFPLFDGVAQAPVERASSILVVGTGGEDEYATFFKTWAADWQKACAAGDVRVTATDARESLVLLRKALENEPREGSSPLWIVLFGHGTSDGKEAKFNLPGDDLAASELATLLKPFQRPLIIVCGFSASGAFLKPLSGPGRVLIAATKSGSENNYARFGGYFAESICDPLADFDKDGQTSVLEAWLLASQQAADFYKNEGRLATEHSLLEDNGDGLGTPSDWYKGLRTVKKSKTGQPADGLRAHQVHLVPSKGERSLSPEAKTERDTLELELARLRETKGTLTEDAYYAKIEPLLRQLARLYHDTGTPH
ncbi:MAG: hypothetical protein V4710_00290 [Verrucomicrobiota bacterium]